MAAPELHLEQLIFQTGAFLTAWSWVLVYYGAAHVILGESPLENQIGLGDAEGGRRLADLVLQYLAVCGLAAWAAGHLKASPSPLSRTLGVAVTFFPSPVFSGLLMAYLGDFRHIQSRLGRGLLNLAASWVIAVAVFALPTSRRCRPLTDVVRGTVGFGLGVAWHVLLSGALEPVSSKLVAWTLYLLLVFFVAARLAAPEPQEGSLRQRHAALLSFAAQVVCAFALSDWLARFTPTGWVGGVVSLVGVSLLAATLSALVARLDLEGAAREATREATSRKGTPIDRLMGVVAFVPCVWCCCPLVPLLWLLAGSAAGVKDRWLRLTADVCSLAASVIGSNLLTSLLDSLSADLGLCSQQSCPEPAATVGLQALTALAASVALITAVAPLAPAPPAAETQAPSLAVSPWEAEEQVALLGPGGQEAP